MVTVASDDDIVVLDLADRNAPMHLEGCGCSQPSVECYCPDLARSGFSITVDAVTRGFRFASHEVWR
jgi:hypothetical protein